RGEAHEDGRGRQGNHGAHPGPAAGRPADPHRLRDGEGRHRLEGLRRGDRRRLAGDDLPQQLQRPDPEGWYRRPGQDARRAQQVGPARGPGEGRREEVSSTAPVSEVLELEGALSFESLPGVLAESEKYAARTDLPDRLVID